MTVIKQHDGVGVTTDPDSWDTVLVGAQGVKGDTGDTGPTGADGLGVPAGGATGEVLTKASGADNDTEWTAVSGSGVSDGDKGDIVVSGGGTSWSLDPLVVSTLARTVLDDVSYADMRTTIGAAPLARTISTTAPLAGGGDLSADRTLTVGVFDDDSAGVVPLSGGGTTNFLRADGTWAAPAGSGLADGDKGDIVVSASGATWMFDSGVVTTAAKTVLDDTTTAAMLTTLGAAPTTVFTDVANGLAPLSGGGAVNYLRADGTWSSPPGVAGVSNSATFSYNATTTEPPTGSQIRANNATLSSATRLWVMQLTVDGLDVAIGLARILPGHQIYFQDRDNAANWVKYNVTASTDDGTYYDFTVTYHSGGGTVPAGQVEFQAIAPGTVGVPAGGTTSQALIKTSGTDYAVSWGGPYQPVDTDLTTIAGLSATTDNFMVSVSSAWASRTPTQAKATLGLDNVTNTSDANKPVSTAQQTALDLKADLNQTINAQTGTSYTLVLTDNGRIITLTNASAITLTVPTNASVAFPVGASITLIQGGAGQFTVTGAVPPTIKKAMATAKSRAQESIMSLIKTATDVWHLGGDAAAS